MTEPKPTFLAIVRAIAVLLISLSSLEGQQPAAIDLLKDFDPTNQVIAGEWTANAEGLRVAAGKAARCVLATEVADGYDVSIEFVRAAGDDSVVLILPLGEISPALELSAWQGECHGLSRVDGLSSRNESNPTSVRPGTLDNATKYLLKAQVRRKDEGYRLSASLNGETLFEWSGKTARLLPNIAMNLPQAGSLGLAAQNSAVTFSKAELIPVMPAKVPVTTATPASKERGFGALKVWQTFNDGQLRRVDEDDRNVIAAMPAAGEGDRGAFLIDEEFSTGTIEVDLKGASVPGGSFVGVAFHGVNGDTYDAVYFRPFNFGHQDPVRRGHAVQYMSHPQWPWDKLRNERPEEFESQASPEPESDEWFKARIDVQSERIRVFVNEAAEPCLDVEKLGDVKTGKLGLWFNGIAEFSNFRFTRSN